jgi:predicted methyltransferase
MKTRSTPTNALLPLATSLFCAAPLFWAVTLCCATLFAGCGTRGAIRTSAPITVDVVKPPTQSRDVWQQPETIIAHLELQAGMSVIDLGAGDGYMTPHLAAAVGAKGTVHAVEIEPKLVAALRARITKSKLTNVDVLHSTVDDLPTQTKADRILLLNTYPELVDPVGMTSALKKRLKPGGWLVVIDYEPKPGVPGPPLNQRLALGTIEAEARGAGLSLVASSDALPRQYIAVFMRAEEVSVPPPAAPTSPAPLPSDASEGNAP